VDKPVRDRGAGRLVAVNAADHKDALSGIEIADLDGDDGTAVDRASEESLTSARGVCVRGCADGGVCQENDEAECERAAACTDRHAANRLDSRLTQA
jgi:hypothetical protein